MRSIPPKHFHLELSDLERRRWRLGFIFEFTLGPDRQLASWKMTLQPSSRGQPVQPAYERESGQPPDVIAFETTFPCGLRVLGKLRCQHDGRVWLVWAEDLDYGFSHDVHEYAGGMVEFTAPAPTPSWPDPPPPPPPGPSPAPSEEPPAVIITPVTRGGELFPYVYMRTWPEPSSSELELHFVRYPYPLDQPPSGEFLIQLCGIRDQGGVDARERMERLAVSYIEGGVGSTFVSKPWELGAPFDVYPALAELLHAARELPPEETIALLWKLLKTTPEQLREQLDSEAYTSVLVNLWQSYFALVIELGYQPHLRDTLAKYLVVDHLLRWLLEHSQPPKRRELDSLANASPVLPARLFPLPPEAASPMESPPREGSRIIAYAIGDLQMVRQELVGYALGDLAYVESLMAGERRESVRRKTSQETQTSTRLHSDENANGREALGGSTSLTSEVKSTLADIIEKTSYNDFSTNYGPPTTATLNGSWSVETAPGSGGPGRSDLQRFAKSVLEKASERITRQVLEARRTSTTRESVEATTSVLDNTGNAHGRHGVYRWLNEVHRACVVNYGNRMVLEFLVPSPAENYLAEEDDLPGNSTPPVPPAALGIESFEDITPQGFPMLAARYPSEDLRMPPDPRHVVTGLVRSGQVLALSLPKGYQATTARVGYVLPPGQEPFQLEGLVGQARVSLQATATDLVTVKMNQDEGTVQVLLLTSGPLASPPVDLEPAQLTVELEAAPSRGLMDEWRLETFRAIHQSYAAQLSAYEGLPRGGMPPEEAPHSRQNYRTTERKELKRKSFDLLFQTLQEHVGEPGGSPPPGIPSELDIAYPRYLQFFERAFEWDESSYSFIMSPRGRGARRTRTSLMSAGDERFLDFLEAAYARLLIPVTPPEALSVLFFLASGMLWEGRADRVAVHESDLALANELKKLGPGASEVRPMSEPWEFTVPTTITVLQEFPIEGLRRLEPTHAPRHTQGSSNKGP
ncbi:hypothetical protein JRI60_08890 [Archangium violaceum]|uniref:hypothetical protein n=1 Tax=Archangium violaceum TaxID=83451 RepID=UPI001951562A|nr:hypothetical protein [Archangium violaceum]QRN99116.1 hypothetical protein JRI60_08890 [Archangium violaceum]